MGIIKTIHGHLLSWLGLADVPGIIKSFSELTGAVGQRIEISETTEDGTVLAVKAINANADSVSKDYVDEAIAGLRDDINYKPIAITSISVRPNLVQIGSAIVNPTVSWVLSKEPEEQSVGGVVADPSARSYVVEGNFTAKKPGETQGIVLRVVDERGAVAEKTASMVWHNAVYYTDHWPGGVPTDADLWAMPQKLQSGRGLTISAASGDGEYVLYACPKRMGTPEFWANGFQGGFRPMGILNHINPHGYREEYSIYISEAAGLTATITVK